MRSGPVLVARRTARALAFAALFLLLPPRLATATPVATPTAGDAPVPVAFPRDDGPHDVATEWWYYTGHLFTERGDRYGFELVFFKVVRPSLAGYAAHFAITDNPRGRFRFDQRAAGPERVSRPGIGFDLTIGDWSMRGANGRDGLEAAMPGYAIDLALEPEKPPALHDGDGYIVYPDGTASYYYSRTRLAVAGTLTVEGIALPVTGEAWMDHQWGDFETYEEGGWDWFALQFADNTELMLYLIRDPTAGVILVDGSLVDADGSLTVLEVEDFAVEELGSWTSPRSGVTYPSGWRIRLPAEQLDVMLTPSQPDQELDTSATTGVTYWEGEVTVEGTRDGEPITGLGYVELTGYAVYRGIERESSPDRGAPATPPP